MNQDRKMLDACTGGQVSELFERFPCEHPLDKEVIDKLKFLREKLKDQDDDYEIFRYRDITDKLWSMLLEKAIKCLRYYDQREPFRGNEKTKKPKAYGIEDLRKYYEKYAEFEEILYGSSRHYRDHVIHVFRTWLSGVELLTKNKGNCLGKIAIQEKDKKIKLELNEAEKISMWTIIALTHDLGYPLQKAKGIISVTQDMLATFITNPDISVDFAFHGVQNYMNDFVVRLMSSKMERRRRLKEKSEDEDKNEEKSENEDKNSEKSDGKDKNNGEDYEEYYVARLQSKYYFKFQKSLERNSHGILSTLITYKLLTYFLESDYNINEDYAFDNEECRQFYIRREILRAVASHTCDDIYQMYMGSFSFLLRICDDTQEWGRKNITELYVKSEQKYELKDICLNFHDHQDGTNNSCEIKERISVNDGESVITLIRRFREQALVYVTIFRDGQDTNKRDFSFKRKLTIEVDSIAFDMTLEIKKEYASNLSGTITYTSSDQKNRAFGKEFFETIKAEAWSILDVDGKELISAAELQKKPETEMPKASAWKQGEFSLSLAN